ncbi:MAG TPA: hypothetical protein VF736_03705 [Pyrinomonadaceae bacterium]|jgi:hypothetical protein
MAFIIQNRARHLLVLPLNSGETLHLAPGETSPPVEEYELDKNAKVERLMQDGLVTATRQGPSGGEAPRPDAGRRRRGDAA